MRAFLHRSPVNAPLALKGNTVIKGYVRNSRERPIPGEWEPHPETAMVWGTKEQAERACRDFASLGLSVEGSITKLSDWGTSQWCNSLWRLTV